MLEDCQTKWAEVFYMAELNFVQLLQVESSKVIAKPEKDLDDRLKRDHSISLGSFKLNTIRSSALLSVVLEILCQ